MGWLVKDDIAKPDTVQQFFASVFTNHNNKVWKEVWQPTVESNKLETT